MLASDFYRLLVGKFPFTLTEKQDVFLQKMAQYCLSSQSSEAFILKGYAGTGKTTLISVLADNLKMIHQKSVLLAPTGRAAKVISGYSGKEATTIHKKIYFPKKNKNGGVSFTLQPNKHKNTLFIVDEASMISDAMTDTKLYENGSLLDDLIFYVSAGQNCKLLFLGDTAQLPPVNLLNSPALDAEQLSLNYNLEVQQIELDEVMRQESDSGILYNATELRQLLQEYFPDTFQFKLKGFNDIDRLVDGYDIENAINHAYDTCGIEDTAIVLKSNKRANQYNQQIRNKILSKESELSVGDYLMVVKNNYFWLKEDAEAGFIANGDIIEVLEIFKFKELYGFNFANVKIRMVDYPNQKPIETTLILNTLTSESPALTYEQSNELYQEILKDFEGQPGYRKLLNIKQNPFFNALQVKFAYAVTCHKSQGGQWHSVFVEQPYLPNGIDKEYIRWLYTAITRAKEKLYLIGFKNDFFED